MMNRFKKLCTIVFLCASMSHAFMLDSLFEPIMKPFQFLPDNYMRFDISTFALHPNSFFKRQYLAEPHPDLEFVFISYKDIIASVWHADFQFGLGEVPGNNTFTVLNVAFGITPSLELRLKDHLLTGGIAHRCFHEIDRSDFPIVWYNKIYLEMQSKNARINTFWKNLMTTPTLTFPNRFAWDVNAGYYIKELTGIANPDKLNGENPLIWEGAATCRYAIHRRPSWIFALRGESSIGTFDKSQGYHVKNGGDWFFRQGLGFEAYFIRGKQGGCLYAIYHLDDLPAPAVSPAFTLGNSRFSKNGLAQIGLTFFN